MTSSSERRPLAALRGVSVAVAVALTVLGSSLPAAAQARQPAAPGDPKEMARRLGEEALGLHQEGRFAEAYSRFETAERIAHSPVFVLWMARGKRATGSLLAARALYDKVVAEELPVDASPNWIKARAEAVAERQALAARIPRLEVRFSAGAPPDARLEVDGRPIRAGDRVELDPGEHHVRASATGAAPVERRVRLEEGVSAPPVVLALAPPFRTKVPAPADGSIVPGAITLGVGAATVVAGGACGVYALVLAGEVNEGCRGDLCRRSDAGKADDADTLARVATGLLAGGAAVSAAGIVLLATRPFGASAESVAVSLGPTSARVRVRF